MSSLTHQELVEFLKEKVSQETGRPVKTILEEQSFGDLGLDSVKAIYILDQLEEKSGIDLHPILISDYPTIRELVNYVIETLEETGK